MPGKQLKRLYDVGQFKKADRLQRLLIHITDPDHFILTPTDEKYLQRIRRCFAVLCSTFSDASLDKVLAAEFPTMNARQLSKLRQDTNAFYDAVKTETKAFNWLRQYQRILRHLELAQESGDMKSICDLEKILAVMRTEMPEGDPVDLTVPAFEFTTDPQHLHETEEAEIIEEYD